MKYFQKLGMPASKMMMGLGTYGRGDTPAMPYTGFKGENGFVSYYEVCCDLNIDGPTLCPSVPSLRAAFKLCVRK